MAHFYGTVQGQRGQASRPGSPTSGLDVTAASWQGAVCVRLSAANSVDRAVVSLERWHSAGTSRVLYDGPVSGADTNKPVNGETQPLLLNTGEPARTDWHDADSFELGRELERWSADSGEAAFILSVGSHLITGDMPPAESVPRAVLALRNLRKDARFPETVTAGDEAECNALADELVRRYLGTVGELSLYATRADWNNRGMDILRQVDNAVAAGDHNRAADLCKQAAEAFGRAAQ